MRKGSEKREIVRVFGLSRLFYLSLSDRYVYRDPCALAKRKAFLGALSVDNYDFTVERD